MTETTSKEPWPSLGSWQCGRHVQHTTDAPCCSELDRNRGDKHSPLLSQLLQIVMDVILVHDGHKISALKASPRCPWQQLAPQQRTLPGLNLCQSCCHGCSCHWKSSLHGSYNLVHEGVRLHYRRILLFPHSSREDVSKQGRCQQAPERALQLHQHKSHKPRRHTHHCACQVCQCWENERQGQGLALTHRIAHT